MSAELKVLQAEPLGNDLVIVLEEALEMARDGRLSSVAVCGVFRDGCTWQMHSDAPSAGLMIASLAILQHKLMDAVSYG
jgi:hypothetical protein